MGLTMRRGGTVTAAGLAVAIWAISCEPAAVGAPAIGVWADSLAREAMATGHSPGMSVAIVSGGRIVWAAGFGHADRETGRPVRPDTRFYIASTTKALTALAAARLASRGTLDLDAPLSRALAGARFAPGVPADSIRVRDLLTHTHGIEREGPISLRVSFTGEYTNDDLMRLLQHHGPAQAGRVFTYSNLGYELLSVVLAREGRDGWKAIVEREVTRPLGMRATTAWRSRVPADSLAEPYEMGPAGPERIRLAKEDANLGPAGGHFSTATDLARLLITEMDGGRLDGHQAIDRAVIAETQRWHVHQDRMSGPFHRHGWGLGWDLGTYEGDTLLSRFGGFAGYQSHVSFMPRRGLGVVVLVNGGGAASAMTSALAAAIYDRLLGRPEGLTRYRERLATASQRIRESQVARRTAREARAARPQALRLPLDAYAGRFVSPTLGTLTLEVVEGRLRATMGAAVCPVEVFDAAKHQLRVELFGSGEVLSAFLADDSTSVTAFGLINERFERR